MWHGWLLEGSGSNVAAACVAEALRRDGHDVALLCQESHSERLGFLDATGSVSSAGVAVAEELGGAPAAPGGRAVLLRPDIGSLLPVFVYDDYEGFEVKRFVDLSAEELEAYLERNVEAVRAAAAWHDSEAFVFGHVVPGGVVGRRALGPGRHVVKVHGSDLEYAVRLQERYVRLAREGLEDARAVVGPSRDVLDRTVALVPGIRGRFRVVAPGVEVGRFGPREGREGLVEAGEALADAPAGGRPSSIDAEVARAVERRQGGRLDALARSYDQNVPDPDAASRLVALARDAGPLVGYIGKFIPQKGVHHLVAALAVCEARPRAVLVGFGTFREWLAALVAALDRGDAEAVGWIDRSADLGLGLTREDVEGARGLGDRVTFTGRLDHRYAPPVLGALDVLVVPSVLEEAFGMVAAEGAVSGALPLVARHSGLAEVAETIEAHLARPGLLGYDPREDPVRALAAALDRLLALEDLHELRRAVGDFSRREWTWDRTASGIVAAAADPAAT